MTHPIQGKRYSFPLNNYDSHSKSGLFTGEYDPKNGNAILMTKNGDTWSIPVSDLTECDRHKCRGQKGR